MFSVLKPLVFLAASAGIVSVSRASLKSIHMHGFYRFFAWESVLALALLNMEEVVYGPSNMHQIIAYVCLAVSLLLAVHGFFLLHKIGKPNGHRPDPSLLWVEKTTVLVTVGAYRYVRHPLYCSFFFLTWSVFLLLPTWQGSALALIATFSLIMAAKVEERENVRFFGEAYCEYVKQTKMFIPFVI